MNDENNTIQPIAFDKLSVTTDSNRQAVRGSKCSAEYDTEDDLKLLDGKLYTFITMPSKASATKCWALDERGERQSAVPVDADAEGRATVEIGPKYATVWYEITVE